jgi:G protein beta subunit-like protein
MEPRTDPGPWLVTAAYDLCIAFSPIFKDQSLTGRPPKTQYTSSQTNRLVVSPENRIAAAANTVIIVYDATQTALRPTQFSGHQANVTDVVFVGTQLFACSEDRTWQIWDLKQNLQPAVGGSTGSALNALAVLPSRERLITADENGQLSFWDVRQPSKPATVCRIGQRPIRSIALGNDGRRLIAGGHDGRVSIVNVSENTIEEGKSFEAHSEPLLRVMIAPDETTFITTAADESAKLWNINDYSQKHLLKEVGQEKWVWDAVYAHGSDWVVTVGTDKCARTWECASGQCIFSAKDTHQKGIIACTLWPAQPRGT